MRYTGLTGCTTSGVSNAKVRWITVIERLLSARRRPNVVDGAERCFELRNDPSVTRHDEYVSFYGGQCPTPFSPAATVYAEDLRITSNRNLGFSLYKQHPDIIRSEILGAYRVTA